MRLPLFLDLRDKAVLLVGAGCVARAKLRVLAATGAKIRIVALRAAEGFETEAAAAGAELILRAVQPADLAGMHLVVSATNDPAVNARIATDARRAGIWIVSVDDPASCDAFFASQITVGPLHLALSSHGRLPGLMRALRLALEELMPHSHHDPLQALAELRSELKRLPDPRRRAEALKELAAGLRNAYLPSRPTNDISSHQRSSAFIGGQKSFSSPPMNADEHR